MLHGEESNTEATEKRRRTHRDQNLNCAPVNPAAAGSGGGFRGMGGGAGIALGPLSDSVTVNVVSVHDIVEIRDHHAMVGILSMRWILPVLSRAAMAQNNWSWV
jgi:hypothetical protein